MLRSLRRSSQVDMIHEKPLRAFLWFTFPLLLGNLLQQMYSTVDSIVVGNLVGKDALAAVGAGSSITSLMLSFFSGISAGASIVVSNIMGKKEEKKPGKADAYADQPGFAGGSNPGRTGLGPDSPAACPAACARGNPRSVR